MSVQLNILDQKIVSIGKKSLRMKNLTEIENLQELRNPMVIKDRMTMCTRNNYTIMMLGSKSLAVSLHNFLLIFLTKNSNCFSQILQCQHHKENGHFSEEWAYSNDGFEDEPPEQRPVSFVRKPSLKLESPDANKRTTNARDSSPPHPLKGRRTVSRTESESSYRLPSQPRSPIPKEDYYPIIPKEDYPIPRAELEERRPKRTSQSDMSDGVDSGKEYIAKVNNVPSYYWNSFFL